MNIGSATLTILGVVLILFGASARNRSLLVAPSSANRLTQQSATDPELIVATHQSPKSADFRDDIAIQHILPGPATPRHTSDRRRRRRRQPLRIGASSCCVSTTLPMGILTELHPETSTDTRVARKESRRNDTRSQS